MEAGEAASVATGTMPVPVTVIVVVCDAEDCPTVTEPKVSVVCERATAAVWEAGVARAIIFVRTESKTATSESRMDERRAMVERTRCVPFAYTISSVFLRLIVYPEQWRSVIVYVPSALRTIR